MNLYHRYESAISYLFFGGLTTVINTVVFFALYHHMNYQVANAIAWFLSVLFAFITNKLWVFHSKSFELKTFVWETFSFFGFRLASLVIDMLILWIGITLLSGNALLVKIIDQVVVILLNYFFSKWFIFKKPWILMNMKRSSLMENIRLDRFTVVRCCAYRLVSSGRQRLFRLSVNSTISRSIFVQ